jgi:membrane associated rhomboid family serine protease
LGQESLLLRLTFSPGQGLLLPGLVSHMFVHQNFAHLFFNMFLLYSIGTFVEHGYGTKPYVIVYFLSGLMAALAQAVVEPNGLLLGASGALAGVLAVFVRHLPRAQLLVFGIVPMPAWLLAVLWMGYNLVGALMGGSNIAFVAHIAGFAAGFLLSLVLAPPRSL